MDSRIVLTIIALSSVIPFVARVHSTWAAAAPLFLLASPLFAGGFSLSGLIAPSGASRKTLLGSAAVQGVMFAGIIVVWVVVVLGHAGA